MMHKTAFSCYVELFELLEKHFSISVHLHLRKTLLSVCFLNLAKVEMSANGGTMRGPLSLTVSPRLLLSQASETVIVLRRERCNLPRLAPISACMQVLGNRFQAVTSWHGTHRTCTPIAHAVDVPQWWNLSLQS